MIVEFVGKEKGLSGWALGKWWGCDVEGGGAGKLIVLGFSALALLLYSGGDGGLEYSIYCCTWEVFTRF